MVVTASGRLAADAPPVVLQPLERAIIKEVRVRPGDLVTRGQTLVILNPTFAAADTAALTVQRRVLTAQRRRLEAELAGESMPVPDAADPDALLQTVLLGQRQALHAARMRSFSEEIDGLIAGIRTFEHSGTLLAEQAEIARDIEAMRLQLMRGRVGSRLNLLGSRGQRLQAEQELGNARNKAAELRHALRSKQADWQAYQDDWRRQVMEELVRVRAEVAQVEEALAKASRLSELTVVTAPQDGIVLDVARRSAGSVLREAEPLVSTLIPTQVPLMAELAVRSADVGYTRLGDPVVLKVDAFPFQRHGVLHGELRSVAQESFVRHGTATADGRSDPASMGAGAAFHLSQVRLLEGGLSRTSRRVHASCQA